MAFDYSRYSDDELLELHQFQEERAQAGRKSMMIGEIRAEMERRSIAMNERPVRHLY